MRGALPSPATEQHVRGNSEMRWNSGKTSPLNKYVRYPGVFNLYSLLVAVVAVVDKYHHPHFSAHRTASTVTSALVLPPETTDNSLTCAVDGKLLMLGYIAFVSKVSSL